MIPYPMKYRVSFPHWSQRAVRTIHERSDKYELCYSCRVRCIQESRRLNSVALKVQYLNRPGPSVYVDSRVPSRAWPFFPQWDRYSRDRRATPPARSYREAIFVASTKLVRRANNHTVIIARASQRSCTLHHTLLRVSPWRTVTGVCIRASVDALNAHEE